MATTNRTNSLKVSELDFDGIKGAFKTFLQNQNEFRDYDFEGSGLSVLLDILAYNTHYNAFYSNMLASEMFLDSSVVRENVVSRAKQLGYTPSSLKGSKVEVNITLTNDTLVDQGTTQITIPKGTKFGSTLGNKTYVFATTAAESAILIDPTTTRKTFTARGVELREGVTFSQTYAATGDATQRFEIPSSNVDISSVSISVNGTKFNNQDDYTEVKPSTDAFFTQEGRSGKYEFYFGDGNIGTKLNASDSVRAYYSISMAGTAGNGARVFQPLQEISGIDKISVVLANSSSLYSSSGGAERESIDSIKYLAPLNFESQDRAVTVNDYRARVLNDIPGVDAVNVWGGEYNQPPEYGKVFIAIKPTSGYVLSKFEEERIKNTLKQKNLVSITPEIVQPDYLYPVLTSQVMYDPSTTSTIVVDLKAIIASSIQSYSDGSLTKFDTYYRHSILTNIIDLSEKSIVSNLTTVKIRKPFTPSLSTNKSYVIRFSNPLLHPHDGHMSILSSTRFSYLYNNNLYVDCSLIDQDGIVKVTQRLVDGSRKLLKNTGTIDYDSGIVNLQNFIPVTIRGGGSTINLTVQPRYSDILTAFNQLIVIDPNDVYITLVDDRQLTSTDRPVTSGDYAVSRGTYSISDSGGSGSSGGSGGSRGY